LAVDYIIIITAYIPCKTVMFLKKQACASIVQVVSDKVCSDAFLVTLSWASGMWWDKKMHQS